MSDAAELKPAESNGTTAHAAPAAPAEGKGKGKGKQAATAADSSMEADDDDDDDDDDEEEDEEEDEDEDMEEDAMEEIDPSVIIGGGRRTRGVKVDYTSKEALEKAGLKPGEEDEDD